VKVTLDLTYDQLQFLRDLVGGTGDFAWGDLARHYSLTTSGVEDIFNKLDIAYVECGVADLNPDAAL
jgi:hypothetical protein